MHRHSIRFRLTVWYAVVLTAGLALFGVLLWVSLRHQLLADIDDELDGRASRFESYFRKESAEHVPHLRAELEEFCQALPPTSYVVLRGSDGFTFAYPENARTATATLRMQQRSFAMNGATFDLNVGAPATNVVYVLNQLRFLLWSLIPVVILIACLGGVWLSRRALRPVQDVTAAALMISIENLSERVPVPATGDEIARLAEVVNSMLARLESAVKTLSQFVADASHELRTPLAVIRTTAELALRRGRSPESYRESLEDVVSEAQRMTQLVEDLLILARTDAQIVEMPRAPVDLRDILQAVALEMSSLAQTRQIHIQTALGDAPAIIAGNRPALHRLFLGLLDNALKYSHPSSQVIVAIERQMTHISVIIQDFGAGIGQADLTHIFERFYRADRSRTGSGHGLGLPLAESIAIAHRAKIEVQSAAGAGSTFTVIFPSRDLLPDSPQAAKPGALARK
ncbi:MAG: ATP-binding protein [Acidobacteriota bacterium]|nr:ATP-binding protein [Acidobacteriota bacterium]